jgi:hypothetical protein
MRINIALAVALVAAVLSSRAGAEERGVLAYHNDAARSGHFVVPGLTWEKARALRPDTRFAARVAGHLYAQPLAWRAPGSNTTMLLTASEDDVVQAFDGQTGNELWRRAVGTPAARSSCRAATFPRSASPARRRSMRRAKEFISMPWSRNQTVRAIASSASRSRTARFYRASRSTWPTRCARAGRASSRAIRTSAPR